MKRILIAGTALALVTAPAQAQLLGGGLGGNLGGQIGGTLGGAGSIGSATESITNTTRGTMAYWRRSKSWAIAAPAAR